MFISIIALSRKQADTQPQQKKEISENNHKFIQRNLAFGCSVLFVAAILLIARFDPAPSLFQYSVYRIVLVLFSGGVVMFFPGEIELKFGKVLRASGALAVIAMVYFYSPAALESGKSESTEEVQSKDNVSELPDSNLQNK